MLANPMSSEQSVMRTSLLAGLIDAAKKNAARQQDSGRLFEVGLVFKPPHEQEQEVQQDLTVGGLCGGVDHLKRGLMMVLPQISLMSKAWSKSLGSGPV